MRIDEEKALEVRRQVFHLVLGLVFVALISKRMIEPVQLLVVCILAILASLYCRKHEVPVISWFLKAYERPNKLHKFPAGGLIFFMLGILVIFSFRFFSSDVVLASIMILSLGDSVSHVVGMSYGKTANPLNSKGAKLLEGTLAGIFVSFIGASFFVEPVEALIASVVAMSVEAYDLRLHESTLDDNLVVPFVAALTLFLLRFL